MVYVYPTMPFPILQIRPRSFPLLLKEVPDKPAQLYVRGTLPPPEYRLLCVVGSRACSAYGRRQTQKLIAGLAREKIVIVSGLALGIDSEAHKAALDVGIPTVAVLPSSCDDASLYPATNAVLAGRILKSGGALLSERTAPWKAHIHDFAARNRIMAGMSQATLIIEAGEKSGTLITARLALDYNREVLCIPHELERAGGVGANRLLRQGATLVQNSTDILEALGFTTTTPEQIPLPTDLTTAEVQVLHTLAEPLTNDELIERSGLSVQEANVVLSSLLIRGLIVERLGKVERS